MFVYEKDGKLNVQFGAGQIPAETPDIVFEKTTATAIKVNGKDIAASQNQVSEQG